MGVTNKHAERAFKRWMENKRSLAADMGGPAWTDGKDIYSYDTPIVTRLYNEAQLLHSVVINTEFYTRTTKKQVDFLQSAIHNVGEYRDHIILVTGIDRDAPIEQLQRAGWNMVKYHTNNEQRYESASDFPIPTN